MEANTKTKAQIRRAMDSAKISGELSGTGINWEVELADEKTMRSFCKKVIPVGGYRTGYGAWILSANYKSQGDYNDRTSEWHR